MKDSISIKLALSQSTSAAQVIGLTAKDKTPHANTGIGF